MWYWADVFKHLQIHPYYYLCWVSAQLLLHHIYSTYSRQLDLTFGYNAHYPHTRLFGRDPGSTLTSVLLTAEDNTVPLQVAVAGCPVVARREESFTTVRKIQYVCNAATAGKQQSSAWHSSFQKSGCSDKPQQEAASKYRLTSNTRTACSLKTIFTNATAAKV